MTALPNRYYSGHRKAIIANSDQKTAEKQIRRKKCRQQDQIQLKEDGVSNTSELDADT